MLRKLEKLLFYSIVVLLPTQLGKHFWPSFSIVDGIRVDYLSPTLYVTDILVVLLLAIYVSRLLIDHRVKFPISNFQFSSLRENSQRLYPISKLSLLTCLILAVVTTGILLSQGPMAGFYKLIKVAEFGFFGFYVAKNISLKNDLPIITFLFSLGIVFESLLATWQFFRQSSVDGVFWFFGERTYSGQTPGIANAHIDGRLIVRPYGTFSHPNVLAGYLTIAMAMVISNFQFPISNSKKVLFVSAVVMGTVGLLLTLSRVAIVLWLVVLGSWFIRRFSNKVRDKKFFILNSAFFILVFGVVLTFTPLSSRFTSLFDVDKETITRRYELNVAAIEMIKKSPIFGVGLNNFLIELPNYQKPTAGPLWLQPAHNVFLLLTTETGLGGLLIFLWFLLATYRQLKKKKEFPISNFQFPISLTILFLGMFDHYFITLQQGQLLFAFVLGLAWAKKK